MVQRNYVRYYFALIGGRSGLSITKIGDYEWLWKAQCRYIKDYYLEATEHIVQVTYFFILADIT